MTGAHEGRVERAYDHCFGFGDFDNTLDYFKLWGEEIFFVQRHLGPIGRALDVGQEWKTLFVLDFDKIHAGVAEVFKVFVNGGLAAMAGWVEVEKEGGGSVGGLAFEEGENEITFVHGFLNLADNF
jgi:hypothetical protein